MLLAQINEAETGKDSTFGELKKARALNTELDLKLKAVSERLQESDPTIVKQQKELIIDLKNRVNVLEKELLLVGATTNKELADLRK